jgi:hypothetical protein
VNANGSMASAAGAWFDVCGFGWTVLHDVQARPLRSPAVAAAEPKNRKYEQRCAHGAADDAACDGACMSAQSGRG